MAHHRADAAPAAEAAAPATTKARPGGPSGAPGPRPSPPDSVAAGLGASDAEAGFVVRPRDAAARAGGSALSGWTSGAPVGGRRESAARALAGPGSRTIVMRGVRERGPSVNAPGSHARGFGAARGATDAPGLTPAATGATVAGGGGGAAALAAAVGAGPRGGGARRGGAVVDLAPPSAAPLAPGEGPGVAGEVFVSPVAVPGLVFVLPVPLEALSVLVLVSPVPADPAAVVGVLVVGVLPVVVVPGVSVADGVVVGAGGSAGPAPGTGAVVVVPASVVAVVPLVAPVVAAPVVVASAAVVAVPALVVACVATDVSAAVARVAVAHPTAIATSVPRSTHGTLVNWRPQTTTMVEPSRGRAHRQPLVAHTNTPLDGASIPLVRR
jgi:hypothetical protein